VAEWTRSRWRRSAKIDRDRAVERVVEAEETMNPKVYLVPLGLLLALGVIACDGSARPNANSPAPATQPSSNMKINLKLPDKTLTATLYDTPSARDFASMLPLTLTLEDYSKAEKISDLPRKLTKEGAPAGADPSVGDIAYYAPWGNLAIFYKDFGYSDGLILLGKLDGGAEALGVGGSLKVTIELVAKDNPQRRG
jgi:hypothetical protein